MARPDFAADGARGDIANSRNIKFVSRIHIENKPVQDELKCGFLQYRNLIIAHVIGSNCHTIWCIFVYFRIYI